MPNQSENEDVAHVPEAVDGVQSETNSHDSCNSMLPSQNKSMATVKIVQPNIDQVNEVPLLQRKHGTDRENLSDQYETSTTLSTVYEEIGETPIYLELYDDSSNRCPSQYDNVN